ncbi:hypothetical protein QJS10_CPB19g01914 [Acorus calamus]|uniref:DUF1677 family protein n=1 Tax=Acorus calamus TaxID=4465 RepID=A0AAV9CJ41_ACOCL|nr:hypothetical protein QJS10_CPB19g01914 [Acorus calamus]
MSGAVEYTCVRCECCGLAEECTQGYIDRVRERYLGRWICGLCMEAVKEEILRSSLSVEEAMDRHAAFRRKFRSTTAALPTLGEFLSAVRQLVMRSKGVESPRQIGGAGRVAPERDPDPSEGMGGGEK